MQDTKTSDQALNPIVDVVIPVYRGLDTTKRCLESVLHHSQTTSYELIIIDDACPEPELATWLDGLFAAGRIQLLRNTSNRGFTSCANLAFALHPSRDIVLLNSDTEVHGNWLDRLRRAASPEDVGTITPLTNSGTMCSYPRFCAENPMPESETLARLDYLCASLNGDRRVDLPTAVGFCMYLTRRCIDAVGYFDQTHFPRGYGEENDFSMRAAAQGFRNLLVGDVFVAHPRWRIFWDREARLVRTGGGAAGAAPSQLLSPGRGTHQS